MSNYPKAVGEPLDFLTVMTFQAPPIMIVMTVALSPDPLYASFCGCSFVQERR